MLLLFVDEVQVGLEDMASVVAADMVVHTSVAGQAARDNDLVEVEASASLDLADRFV